MAEREPGPRSWIRPPRFSELLRSRATFKAGLITAATACVIGLGIMTASYVYERIGQAGIADQLVWTGCKVFIPGILVGYSASFASVIASFRHDSRH